jgi:hypothetical protein
MWFADTKTKRMLEMEQYRDNEDAEDGAIQRPRGCQRRRKSRDARDGEKAEMQETEKKQRCKR